MIHYKFDQFDIGKTIKLSCNVVTWARCWHVFKILIESFFCNNLSMWIIQTKDFVKLIHFNPCSAKQEPVRYHIEVAYERIICHFSIECVMAGWWSFCSYEWENNSYPSHKYKTIAQLFFFILEIVNCDVQKRMWIHLLRLYFAISKHKYCLHMINSIEKTMKIQHFHLKKDTTLLDILLNSNFFIEMLQ